MSRHDQRRDMIVTSAWETWTRNGLDLIDEEDRIETTKTVQDAVNNTYVDDISDRNWLAATLDRLNFVAPEPTPCRCIGRSPDGARRVYGQGATDDAARYEATEAARDYLQGRPDCGPLSAWQFSDASDADMFAVQFARDGG